GQQDTLPVRGPPVALAQLSIFLVERERLPRRRGGQQVDRPRLVLLHPLDRGQLVGQRAAHVQLFPDRLPVRQPQRVDAGRQREVFDIEVGGIGVAQDPERVVLLAQEARKLARR